MSFAFSNKKANFNKRPQPNKKRFQTNKQFFALAGVAVMFLISGSATLFLVSSSTLSFFNTRSDASYPTSLPWVESKSRCEEFGRVWRNDSCWDGEHSHTF